MNKTPRSDNSAAEYVPVADLRPWVKNPRKNDPAVKAVADSIRRFGFGAPILARRENGEVIAGHTRLKAAIKLGLTEVPVRYLDLSEAEAHALALADNKVGELAEWDDDALAGILRDLDADGVGIADLGWGEAELDALLKKADGLPDGAGADDDAPDEQEEEPDSVAGGVYNLGPHRLVCGDSRDPVASAALLAGGKIGMVWTDPPYGMRLETDYKKMGHGGGRSYAPIAGDAEDYDPRPLMSLVAGVEEQFWFGADYYGAHLPRGGGWFVWDKRFNDSGMELDRLFGSAFELCWSRQPHKREMVRILWAMTHGRQHEDVTGVHPTQKPTSLVRWFLDRWSEPGGIVVDFYGGSGTTLVACAQSGRIARLCELSPAYCDVIRRRWTRWARANGQDPGAGALDG